MGEWLEADGLGGFASGTVDGIRTRRYHALLLTATTPPTGRVVLVNGFEAWVETPAASVALTSQRYAPDVVHPDGASRIETFTPDPWPSWMLGAARRQPDRARDARSARPGGDGARLAAARGTGSATPRGAPPPLRPRLPRAPSREPGVPLRRRASRVGASSGVPIPACPRSSRARTALRARAGLVPELPLHRGASARARLRRGPGVARGLPLGPGARRGAS